MENPIPQDAPTGLCKYCLKQVVRVFQKFHSSCSAGAFKRRKKYSDETGRLWHGQQCPDCVMKDRKDRADKKTAEKQAEIKKLLES